MRNERGVVILAAIFIGLFSYLLGMVIGSSMFDKGLPKHHGDVEIQDEYK